MKQPLVTIITPVYNAEKHIEETITSVLNQTYTNFEHILVDDCSKDNSTSIVRHYSLKDERIKLISLKENSGAAVARNTGLENAEGKFIAFIDSDDTWHPKKLEIQIEHMLEKNYGFTYTKFELINENGNLRKEASKLPKKLSYTDLLKNTAIACSTVVINKEIIGDFKMPLVRKGQDTATWLRILKNHSYAYLVGSTLSQYRSVEGSLSSNKVQALKRTWNTYYNIEKLPFFKALYYFVFYVWNALKRRT